MKNALTVLIAAVFLFAAGAAVIEAQGVDVPAPNFTVKDLQGNAVSLADYKGKVLFVNFWATWCPPCRAEIPDFIEAFKNNESKGLEILGLSVDKLTLKELQSFVADAKMNYPVALADSKIVGDFQPGQYIPATIVIDKKGIIRHREVGQMDGAKLLQLFNKYNAE
ncbi:MAG: TlpA family protein disulfide reductase [Candidatus Aminicenantales bacterium]